MKDLTILAVRIAIGISFLSAVADRLGYWGNPGEMGVVWGNWDNFIQYTSLLNFNAALPIANVLGILATIAEIVFGILLILGYQIRYVAIGSGFLLLLFALAMSINTYLKATFDYSVLVASAAAFLLSFQPVDKYSIDNLLVTNK